MKVKLLLLSVAAPVLIFSAVGNAAAVESDGTTNFEDGKCTTSTYPNGHGYSHCSRTVALNGFATSATGEIDAVKKAGAKNAEFSAEFRNAAPGDLMKKYTSGGGSGDGSGGTSDVPPNAQSSCSFRLASSSFQSWYFPNASNKSSYYDWDPVEDADKPFGGSQNEIWQIGCTSTW